LEETVTGTTVFCLLLAAMLITTTTAKADLFSDNLQRLDDEKARIRMTAAWSLGKSGDIRAIEPLIKHLEDKDKDVRQWIVLALANLGHPATDPLIEALTNSSSSTVRWQAAAVLGLKGDARAVPPLVLALADNSNDTRYWSAIALGQINDSISREPLIQSLGDPNASVRKSAGWALRKIEGTNAADLMISILNEENSSKRSGAAAALGEANSIRAVYALISALSDPESDVRSIAADSLGNLNDMDSLAVLVQSTSIKPLVQTLTDNSPEVRNAARNSLTKMGKVAVGELIQVLGEGEFLGRSEAAELLGDIGDTQAINPLIEAFKEGDKQVRYNAVLSLMKLNKTSCVEAFIDLLESESAEVRTDAAWALGLAGDARAKNILLQTMAQDKDSRVRLSASKALRELGAKWEPVARVW
jgi:HEAT repeat protein